VHLGRLSADGSMLLVQHVKTLFADVGANPWKSVVEVLVDRTPASDDF